MCRIFIALHMFSDYRLLSIDYRLSTTKSSHYLLALPKKVTSYLLPHTSPVIASPSRDKLLLTSYLIPLISDL